MLNSIHPQQRAEGARNALGGLASRCVSGTREHAHPTTFHDRTGKEDAFQVGKGHMGALEKGTPSEGRTRSCRSSSEPRQKQNPRLVKLKPGAGH